MGSTTGFIAVSAWTPNGHHDMTYSSNDGRADFIGRVTNVGSVVTLGDAVGLGVYTVCKLKGSRNREVQSFVA